MPGAIVILIVLAIFPSLVCIGSGALAAGLGWVLNRDGQQRNEGSELLDLNV